MLYLDKGNKILVIKDKKYPCVSLLNEVLSVSIYNCRGMSIERSEPCILFRDWDNCFVAAIVDLDTQMTKWRENHFRIQFNSLYIGCWKASKYHSKWWPNLISYVEPPTFYKIVGRSKFCVGCETHLEHTRTCDVGKIKALMTL